MDVTYRPASVKMQENGYDCGIMQLNYLEALYVKGGIASMSTGGSTKWNRPKTRKLLKKLAKVTTNVKFVWIYGMYRDKLHMINI